MIKITTKKSKFLTIKHGIETYIIYCLLNGVKIYAQIAYGISDKNKKIKEIKNEYTNNTSFLRV